MRQLIARIDDDLHERLKARAAAEGRSLNSLVRELLVRALPEDSPRERLRARAASSAVRVVPTVEGRPPSRAAAIAGTRGAGRAASEALAADRERE